MRFQRTVVSPYATIPSSGLARIDFPPLVLGCSSVRIRSTALSLLPAPQFRSFQCPLQPLERAGSFAGANCRLAVIAIANTYQDGDVLESFLHKCQNLFELNGLSVC